MSNYARAHNFSAMRNKTAITAPTGDPSNLLDAVLQSPQQIVPAEHGRKAYQSQIDFGGRLFLVRVIVDDTVDPAFVFTVCRTSRIARYWRI